MRAIDRGPRSDIDHVARYQITWDGNEFRTANEVWYYEGDLRELTILEQLSEIQ